LLLDLKPTDFYYSGKMRDDSGIPLDVYVGETASSKNGGAVVWSNETVVELFFWPQNLENGETRKLHSVAYYYKV
jgi:hypothetical protein